MIGALKRGMRHRLEAKGYYLRHRRVLPYGFDYMLDIERLCRAWDLSVRTFFDVGAHWGETSALALARFPDARLFAFEPSASTFAQLCSRLGTESRFSAHNIALSDVCGEVPFFEYDSSDYNSLVANPPPESELLGRQISVPCTTVDAFCAKHAISSIEVLKVDAERCDLWVLRGAENMLATGQVRFVYFEFNDALPTPGTQESALVPISEILGPFGYRFVATYVDRIDTDPMFVVANALFVQPGSPRNR